MSYKAHALKIGSNWIGGILKSTATNQANVNSVVTAGSIYPLNVNITEVKNSFGFTTNNVATALGIIGAAGLALGGGTAAELYEILYTDNGQIASGTAHRKMAFALGRVIPRRLSCQHRQDATLDIEVMGLSADGLASPLVFTESVALPTALDDARHTIYNATVASYAMGCLQDMSFDFGIGIESAGCNSNVFDTRIQINEIKPKITITTLNSELAGTASGKFKTTGTAATHANTIFQLRKRITKTAQFVADATTEHIKITCDGTVVPTTMFDASNNADGTSTFEITGTFDGTNLPFVVNPAVALA